MRNYDIITRLFQISLSFCECHIQVKKPYFYCIFPFVCRESKTSKNIYPKTGMQVTLYFVK